MAKFVMREARYIKQRGETEPHYVDANPTNPVVVDLDDEQTVTDPDGGNPRVIPLKVDKRLVPHTEVAPPKPPELIPAHAVMPAANVPSAATAAVATPPTVRKGGRLSDS